MTQYNYQITDSNYATNKTFDVYPGDVVIISAYSKGWLTAGLYNVPSTTSVATVTDVTTVTSVYTSLYGATFTALSSGIDNSVSMQMAYTWDKVYLGGNITISVHKKTTYYSSLSYQNLGNTYSVNSVEDDFASAPSPRTVAAATAPDSPGEEYVFEGWSDTEITTAFSDEDEAKSFVNYTSGSSISVPYSTTSIINKYVYAVWYREPVRYTITYDCDGGSPALLVEYVYNYSSENKITSIVPTKAGTKFVHWKNLETGEIWTTGQKYINDPVSDITLTAQWYNPQFWGKIGNVWKPGDLYFWDGVKWVLF